MSKKVIITGATGFIGKHLSAKLIKEGFSVISMSSADGDIANAETLSKYDGGDIHHVFHLAGNTFVPQSWDRPYDFMRTNVLGTASVLDFCRKNTYSLTYISAYIYGSEVENPIKESFLPMPNNPYALSKKLGEDLCEFYSKFMNVCVNIIRPFNIYGPCQGDHFLVPFIIKQVKESVEVRVKDLDPKRDYIYIDDLIECLMKAMDYKKFDVFNVGSGKSYSVLELIKIVLEVSGKSIPITSENKIRVNEISDTIADIAKAKELLNWEPKIDIKDGIKMVFFN